MVEVPLKLSAVDAPPSAKTMAPVGDVRLPELFTFGESSAM